MIYFIGNKQEGIVKIGYTISKIEQRLHTVRANCPIDVECIMTIEGLKDTEQYLHELFKDHNIRGEWFRIEGKLKEYIDNPSKPDVEETFKPTPRKDRISNDNTEIEKLYMYGLSIQDIADRLGYTHSQVRTFVTRRGLQNKYTQASGKRRYNVNPNQVRTTRTIHIPSITTFDEKS